MQKKGSILNIRWILLAISLAISLGPICVALLMYQSNLIGLVMPERLDVLGEVPQVSVEGFSTEALRLRVSNPYDFALKFESIEAEIYCSTHDVKLGDIEMETSKEVKANSNAVINLPVNLVETSKAHFLSHMGSGVSADLRNLAVNVQGMKMTYDQPISIGTITFP